MEREAYSPPFRCQLIAVVSAITAVLFTSWWRPCLGRYKPDKKITYIWYPTSASSGSKPLEAEAVPELSQWEPSADVMAWLGYLRLHGYEFLSLLKTRSL